MHNKAFQRTAEVFYIIDEKGTIEFHNDHHKRALSLIRFIKKAVLSKAKACVILLKDWQVYVHPIMIKNQAYFFLKFGLVEGPEGLNRDLYKDEATGLYNRNFWEKLCHPQNQQKALQGYGIILLDIDNLKVINDERGHLAGDQAIRIVAEAIHKGIGSNDLAFRYGGDEFLIALANTKARSQLDETIRKIRQNIAVASKGFPFAVQVSIGGAYNQEGNREIKSIIVKADQEMYREKYAKRSKQHSREAEIASIKTNKLLNYLHEEVSALAINLTLNQENALKILEAIQLRQDEVKAGSTYLVPWDEIS